MRQKNTRRTDTFIVPYGYCYIVGESTYSAHRKCVRNRNLYVLITLSVQCLCVAVCAVGV